MKPGVHCRSLECSHDLLSVSAALPQHYPYLLDSAASGPLGEVSLLLRSSGQQLCKHADGSVTPPGRAGGFLDRLDDWYREERRTPGTPSGMPFAGGWFLYLGYELAAEIEPVVDFPAARDGFPIAFADRCHGALFSRPDDPGRLHLVAETAALLEQMTRELGELPAHGGPVQAELTGLREDPVENFMRAVARIHEYILDGDVFQVNLSRGWRGSFNGPADPQALYRALRVHNPAPFAGMIRHPAGVVMSSSPERLVKTSRRVVQSRPIAGTRPRGGDTTADRDLRRELLAHPKERAEHIMLIDLERNDLGRVCETGSVEVDELMVVETYEHVHHIVSNVRGRLRADVTPVDVIRAVFPGGTITGCPKVRCMEIIAELEQQGRSFYTGSFGYLGLDGDMDLNILIRSMLLHEDRISFRTGAGIVADSDARGEVAETGDKARGLLRALGPVEKKHGPVTGR